MGNTVYGKETPYLKYIDAVSMHQIPLTALKSPAKRIQAVCLADQYDYLYVGYHQSKKVHKYSLAQKRVVHTYKFHATAVKYMELNLSQTTLFTLDGNSVYVIDCKTDSLKRVLHTYNSGSEISRVSFFNNRFIVVSLKDCRSFDVFDTKTAVRESMQYRGAEDEAKVSCLDFGCSRDGERLLVLDSEYLYVFRMNKLKEITRINHGGKETAILHTTADSKYVFTLRKGYVTARRLKTLEKIQSFKFHEFPDKAALELMHNDRLLLVRDPNTGIRFIDLLDQETVHTLRHPRLVSSFLSKDNRHIVTVDESKLDVYVSDVELEFSKSAVRKRAKKNRAGNNAATCNELSQRYSAIEDMVRRGEVDRALIECRDILRISAREHRAYFICGKLLLIKELYEESEGFFAQAIFLSLQQEASYFVWRGKALYFMRRYQEALEAFSKALAIDPSKQSASKNRDVVERILTKVNESSKDTGESPNNQSNEDTTFEADITFDYESAFQKAFGRSSSKADSNEGKKDQPFNFRINDEDEDIMGTLPEFGHLKFLHPLGSYYLSEEIQLGAFTSDTTNLNFQKKDQAREEQLLDVSYAKFISTDNEQGVFNLKTTKKETDGFTVEDPPHCLAEQPEYAPRDKKQPPVIFESKRLGKSKRDFTKAQTALLIEQSEEFQKLYPTHSQELARFN